MIRTNGIRMTWAIFAILTANLTFSQPAAAQMGPKDGSTISQSRLDFDSTVSTLTQAIEQQNLMVIHVVDAQKMLRMAGKKVKGMKQIFYFHPSYMKRVMEANPMATIQIPLKIIVMEKPNGKVVLRYFEPSEILQQYKGEAEIAAELDGIVAKVIDSVAKK